MAKTTELAAITGQKILFSRWLSMTFCSVVAEGEAKEINGTYMEV